MEDLVVHAANKMMNNNCNIFIMKYLFHINIVKYLIQERCRLGELFAYGKFIISSLYKNTKIVEP
mgnify:CR=1 FL=1